MSEPVFWLNSLLLSSVVVSGLVALLGLLFRRRSLSTWLFSAGMVLFAAEAACDGLGVAASSVDGVAGWLHRRFWLFSVLPGVWLMFSLCYSRGNYQGFLSRWWLLLALSFGVPLSLAFYFQDDLVVRAVRTDGTSVLMLGWSGRGLHLIALALFILTLMNLERTFRTAVGTMRWQIKFVVLGLVVLFGARVYTSSQAFLYSGTVPTHLAIQAVALLVAAGFFGVSVIRTGMFETDLYPSNVLLTNSFTVLVAGLYLLTVGVLAKVVAVVGGDAGFALKAAVILLALAGLAILLLSDRFRQRIRDFVTRHFQRPMHDYRRLWTLFSQRTASLVEQGEVCAAVAKLISETFETLSVTLWLVDDRNRTLVFGASTVLTAEEANRMLAQDGGAEQVAWGIRDKAEPFDLDTAREIWVQVLQRYHPDFFGKGGTRYAVPFVSGGEVFGLATVGDRVNGAPFSAEDLELLKCLGSQTASVLLNLRLSSRLIEAREMEAFQTISAFFVHDLKNTASTLTLMLENLPLHFHDPAFREDAIQAIGKSAERIKGLIDRLTLVRQELKLNVADADLNQVVEEVVASLGTSDLPLTVRLGAVPRLKLDREQLMKVLTNLLLNAREALGEEGQIELGTGREGDWAVVSVRDNGCGMTPEFMTRHLFRPFQTTKKRGIGIGMFHSKMIVEAHRGRIEVQSSSGQGTTFRVWLPAAPAAG